MTTFVSVGNATQGFSRLIEAVLKIAPHLPQPVVVQHGNTISQGVGWGVKPFLQMEEFSQLVSRAELLILHAGAGSVIHAIQAGKIPVVMPRLAKYGEHVDDHQLEFSRAMAETGKIVVAEEPVDLMNAIHEALRRQKHIRASGDTPPLVNVIRALLQKYEAAIKT